MNRHEMEDCLKQWELFTGKKIKNKEDFAREIKNQEKLLVLSAIRSVSAKPFPCLGTLSAHIEGLRREKYKRRFNPSLHGREVASSIRSENSRWRDECKNNPTLFEQCFIGYDPSGVPVFDPTKPFKDRVAKGKPLYPGSAMSDFRFRKGDGGPGPV